jgi:phosphatidylglycerophosphate synthase
MAYPLLRDIKQANAAVNDEGYALVTLIRHLGPYLAWAAMRLGATPRQVNYLALAVALLILALSVLGGRDGLIVATALVFAWQMIDVTDGTMARSLKIRDNFGGFVDYATGMVMAGFLPLALGVGAFLSPDRSAGELLEHFAIDMDNPSVLVLIAGAGISTISMYMRLINRILFIRFGDSISQGRGSGEASAGGHGLVYNVVKNLETLGGLQAVAFFAGAVLGMLDALLVIYLVFYCVVLAGFAVSVYYSYTERRQYL